MARFERCTSKHFCSFRGCPFVLTISKVPSRSGITRPAIIIASDRHSYGNLFITDENPFRYVNRYRSSNPVFTISFHKLANAGSVSPSMIPALQRHRSTTPSPIQTTANYFLLQIANDVRTLHLLSNSGPVATAHTNHLRFDTQPPAILL